MKKKTRLIILISCIVCFFAIAPMLVAYSIGYRFDFEKLKIVETGGIYIRTFPTAEEITVDSKISVKPSFFSNAVFIQSLLPREHTVSIKKTGYYGYFKSLPVQERTVTKLENVILFKKLLAFSPIVEFPIAKTEKIIGVIWSENSQAALVKTQNSSHIFYYYFDFGLFEKNQNLSLAFVRLPYLDKNSEQISFNPKDLQEIFYVENNILYSLKNKKPSAVIKNLVSYAFLGNDIAWLSASGQLKQSDSSGNLIENLTEKNFILITSETNKINVASQKIFLQKNNSIFLFNPGTKLFEDLKAPSGNYKPFGAPDGKNLILQSSSEAYVYSYSNKTFGKLYSGGKINSLQWLNNDYIIFNADSKILISEIDYRGNINTITLPSVQNPFMYYDFQSGKVYILNNNTLTVSEKLTP